MCKSVCCLYDIVAVGCASAGEQLRSALPRSSSGFEEDPTPQDPPTDAPPADQPSVCLALLLLVNQHRLLATWEMVNDLAKLV